MRFDPNAKAHSQIGNARNYQQILLESFVDLFPARVLPFAFALPIPSGRGLRAPLATMHETSHQLYELGLAAAQSNDKNERRRDDLLSILGALSPATVSSDAEGVWRAVKANLSEKPGQRMTGKEVQDQMLTFIFAGWTAVLGTLTELLAILASPEHTATTQARVRDELLALGPSPTAEQLLGGAAPFLDAVLRESLRYSEPTQLERVAATDDVIPLSKPLRLRDGTYVDAIPVRALGPLSRQLIEGRARAQAKVNSSASP
jgi:cytochrome P450